VRQYIDVDLLFCLPAQYRRIVLVKQWERDMPGYLIFRSYLQNYINERLEEDNVWRLVLTGVGYANEAF